MENVDVKLSTCIDSSNKSNDKDPKFEIGELLECQNIKIFLQKAMFQISLKSFCN